MDQNGQYGNQWQGSAPQNGQYQNPQYGNTQYDNPQQNPQYGNAQYGNPQQNPNYGNAQYTGSQQQNPQYGNAGYQNQQNGNNGYRAQGKNAQPQGAPGENRYSEPDFSQYCNDPGAPKSYLAYAMGVLKARVKGYVIGIPKMLLMSVPFAILTFLFNIFFWSVVNDTMWAGRGTFGSISFMPYLIGGAVYSGSGYKGVTPFEAAGLSPTGKLVAPLTFGLSLLFSRMLMRYKQGGKAAISLDFSSVKKLRDHYEKKLGVAPQASEQGQNNPGMQNPYVRTVNPGQQNAYGNPGNPNMLNAYNNGNPNAQTAQKLAGKTAGYIDFNNLANNIYMRVGLACACIFGFLIRNPFAVPVFAILLYFSFGQGGESDLGHSFFKIRSSDARLYDGRKQIYPRFSEGMLIMYYMSIGLFMYTAVNVVLWIFFNYNYYFRFIVSAGLVAAIIFFGKGGRKQAAGMITSVLLVFAGFAVAYCFTVFADDNGWSESGKSIGGLMHNQGFPKSAWSSLIPGLWWLLGILFGWPDLTLPPMAEDPGYVTPPEPQPWTPVNPYDFPDRPKEWGINDEGDVSFTDPVTGQRTEYGLTGYDENGKGIYIGQNGSYYGEDELINNYYNTLEHLDYYKDAHETGQRNAAEQHAQNQAKWDEERRTGKTEASELWKKDQQELKHQEYLDNLKEKYGTTDEKEIKKIIKQNQVKDGVEYEQQMAKEAIYRELEDYAGKVEKVADVTIDVLGEVTGPVGKNIKRAYNFAKPGMSTLATSLAEGKDGYAVTQDVLLSISQSALDYVTDNADGKTKIATQVLKPALMNFGKAWVEGKDGFDIAQATARGLVEGSFGVINDNTKGVTGFVTSISTDTIKAGLDAYCEGKDVGDAMTKQFTESTINKTIDAGIDYLGDRVDDYAKSKTDKLQKEADNINKFRKEMGTPNNSSVKLNNELQKVANDRLSKIKEINDGKEMLKGFSKNIYKSYLGDNVSTVGDMAVEARHIHYNNLYNTGQKIGIQIRKNGGK